MYDRGNIYTNQIYNYATLFLQYVLPYNRVHIYKMYIVYIISTPPTLVYYTQYDKQQDSARKHAVNDKQGAYTLSNIVYNSIHPYILYTCSIC